jgi:hypothetical protein
MKIVQPDHLSTSTANALLFNFPFVTTRTAAILTATGAVKTYAPLLPTFSAFISLFKNKKQSI